MSADRRAVIVDVDGTLCDVTSALPHVTGPKKDFDAFHAASALCPPTEWVLQYCVSARTAGATLLIVTGRKERWRSVTEAWLEQHLRPWVDYNGPWMRPDDDNRKDTDVKRDIFNTLTDELGWDVVGAIDDRPSVIRLWRSLGIPTGVVYRADWESAGESYEGLI